MGYAKRGHEVTGVDIVGQPNYPFNFVLGDALDYLYEYGHRYDIIHASPPCQKHVKGLAAVNKSLGRVLEHVDYIDETRSLLVSAGLPYVIENVESAPLHNPIKLCGSAFNLPLRRHRLFESNVELMSNGCHHYLQQEKKYPTNWRPNKQKVLSTVVQVYGNSGDKELWKWAMEIPWAKTHKELAQAIPPRYTEFICKQLEREFCTRWTH